MLGLAKPVREDGIKWRCFGSVICIELQDIYTPLWVSGTLQVETVNNELADAAYALDAEAVRVVQESDL